MKKDTSYVLNRAERFHMVLIGEGLLVGAVAGGIVLLYRLVLAYAGEWLQMILHYAKVLRSRCVCGSLFWYCLRLL